MMSGSRYLVHSRRHRAAVASHVYDFRSTVLQRLLHALATAVYCRPT